MTDELREKVARVMCVADNTHENYWPAYTGLATAAIAAVREAEGSELDRLRAALARTEANRDAAMQDATEEHERAERLRADNERLRYEIGRLESREAELAAALQETEE